MFFWPLPFLEGDWAHRSLGTWSWILSLWPVWFFFWLCFFDLFFCFCRDCWSLKMEETRKLSPKPSKSKEPVKTEWGSQSVVFTYFQGDINSMVDEHFSRALSNAKNPQDLSTKHRGETVVLKNGELFSICESGVGWGRLAFTKEFKIL